MYIIYVIFIRYKGCMSFISLYIESHKCILNEYFNYTYFRLFAAHSKEKHNQCESVMEKIKCLLHYFRRVTAKGEYIIFVNFLYNINNYAF